MGRAGKQSGEPLRIAIVWDSTAMRCQMVLNGVCRRAEAEARVSLRRYNALTADFDANVIKPLRAWRPHGVLVRTDDLDQLRRMRKRLAGIPFVTAWRVAPGLADTMVVGDLTEVTRVSRDHFIAQGARSMAFWLPGLPGLPEAVQTLTGMFLKVIPHGPVLVHPLTIAQLRTEPKGKSLREVGDWLRSLPHPAGVLTIAHEAAPYLSRVCHKIGLRIPDDIKLIGCDDLDSCLECTPHLTTVIPTAQRLGEAAMEAILHHLTPGLPRPPEVLMVDGCTLIARGSTGESAHVPHNIARATGLIQERATSGLSASGLARLANQGRSTFYKQFRETTGKTPGKQLRETRIAAACKLLANSKVSISKVSEHCGFSSSNYFAQIFKRETGMSPGEYRNKHAQA